MTKLFQHRPLFYYFNKSIFVQIRVRDQKKNQKSCRFYPKNKLMSFHQSIPCNRLGMDSTKFYSESVKGTKSPLPQT